MKIKCIKTSAAHWGVMFQEGEFYTIEKIENKSYRMINNRDEYMDSLRSITELTPHLQLMRRGEELSNKYKELMDIYHERIEYSKTFKFEVTIPMAYIKDNLNSNHSYCMLNNQQLQEKYNSIYFDTSVDIFDEYFETVDEIRNKKIKELLS